MLRFLISFVIFCGISQFTPAAAQQDVAEILKQAKAKANDEKFEEAEALYKKAIELAPDNANAHNGLGLVFFWKDDYSSAESEFRKASELSPTSAAILANLGDALRQQDKYDEAIEVFQRALKIDPEDSVTMNMLGEVYDWQDKGDLAAEQFTKAYKLNPKSRSIWENYARRTRLNGDTAKAEQLLREAISKNNSDGWAHNQLGLIFFGKKIYLQAENEFKKAVRYLPKSATCYGNLGDTYRAQKRYTEATSIIKRGLEVDGQSSRLNNLMGIVYEEQKKFMLAEEYYKKASVLDSKNGDYLANWAGALFMLDKKDEARETAQRAIDLGCKSHWVFDKLNLKP